MNDSTTPQNPILEEAEPSRLEASSRRAGPARAVEALEGFMLVDGRRPEVPLAVAYWATVGAGSRTAVGHSLRVLARMVNYGNWREIPWHALTPEVVVHALRRAEEAGYKPSTVKRISVAIRGIVRIAWRRGLYDEREVDGLEEAAKRYTHRVWSPRAGRRLTVEETRQQIEHAGDPQMRLILILGLIFGLRRQELCDLECGWVRPDLGHLKVIGKGRKERFVPIPDVIMAKLVDWAAGRPLESPLFLTPKGKKIHTRVMHVILEEARLKAGVAKWRPHDMRRTAVTQLLEAGHDPILVARAVGHNSVATTMVYDRRGDDVTREAFAGVASEVT